MPIKYENAPGPVLVVTMPKEEPSREEFEKHLVYVQRLFDQGKPFGLLIDARLTTGMSAENRRLIAEQKDQMFKADPTRLVGTAVVLSSVLHRSVFSVITWLKSSPSPLRGFADIPAGVAWLGSLLGEASPRARARSSVTR